MSRLGKDGFIEDKSQDKEIVHPGLSFNNLLLFQIFFNREEKQVASCIYSNSTPLFESTKAPNDHCRPSCLTQAAQLLLLLLLVILSI